MNYYYLSLGSNIHPKKNLAQAILYLVQQAGPLLLFPIVETQPCQMESAQPFLNSLALCVSEFSPKAFKAWTNQLEIQAGRNREDPNRAIKDRPLDIDTLASFPVKAHCPNLIPFQEQPESYIQLSLQATQEKQTDKTSNRPTRSILLPAQQTQQSPDPILNQALNQIPKLTSRPAEQTSNQFRLGHRPATIYTEHSGRHIRVIEDTINALLQDFESRLIR